MEGGWWWQGAACRALSCPAHHSAQHPTPHAPTAASRSPRQIRNRVTELLLHHPTVPPAATTECYLLTAQPCASPFILCSPNPPQAADPLPAPHASSPLGCEVPTSSQAGTHTRLPARPSPPTLCCTVPSRADGKAKQTQTLSLHVAPDNGSLQTDLFRAN